MKPVAEIVSPGSRRLAEYLISIVSGSEQGGFFTTAKEHESLILRDREGTDGATPSGNAVAACSWPGCHFTLIATICARRPSLPYAPTAGN